MEMIGPLRDRTVFDEVVASPLTGDQSGDGHTDRRSILSDTVEYNAWRRNTRSVLDEALIESGGFIAKFDDVSDFHIFSDEKPEHWDGWKAMLRSTEAFLRGVIEQCWKAS